MEKLIITEKDWLALKGAVDSALDSLKPIDCYGNSGKLPDKDSIQNAIAYVAEATQFIRAMECYALSEKLRDKAIRIKRLNKTPNAYFEHFF